MAETEIQTMVLSGWALAGFPGQTSDRIVLVVQGDIGSLAIDMHAGQAAAIVQMLGEALHSSGPMQ